MEISCPRFHFTRSFLLFPFPSLSLSLSLSRARARALIARVPPSQPLPLYPPRRIVHLATCSTNLLVRARLATGQCARLKAARLYIED